MLPPSPAIKGLLPPAGSTPPKRAPGPHDLTLREPSPPMIFSGPRTSPRRLSTTVLLRRSSARSLCSLEVRPSLEPDPVAKEIARRRTRVHRIPPRVRDDRVTPLMWDGTIRF